MLVPYNIPYSTGSEIEYITDAISSRKLSGDGKYSKLCEQWLESRLSTHTALLTHSGTGALEMAALLAGVVPGDEVIMPSFTFVSTANAFVLRGATPVFVDIRPDTLNLDESLVEQAVTPKTRCVVPVHYAGVSCDMDNLKLVAQKHRLSIIEDAAHGILASYKGHKLGAIGELGALSFHETKNLIAGEAGAILVNREQLASRAEIIREKGTNRRQFFREQVDKYTWVDLGSSFLPSELQAAYLWSQMENADEIGKQRMLSWKRYNELLLPLEQKGFLRRPIVPADCEHNAHLYYVLLDDLTIRTQLMQFLRKKGIDVIFHYVPLHSSPGGKTFGRVSGSMDVTEKIGETLMRLPLFVGISEEQINLVVNGIHDFFIGSQHPIVSGSVSVMES